MLARLPGFAHDEPVHRPAHSLNLPPEAPIAGYYTTNAFPGINFGAPVAATAPPGETNRLFVADKNGRVLAVTNLAGPTLTPFLDLSASTYIEGESGLLGLAFHPDYRTNRYFYLFYCARPDSRQTNEVRRRLSRFETDPANPNRALPGSESILIEQRNALSDHNGGDLHFGPDGLLYVSLGDGGGEYDPSGNAQQIDRDFFSAIMRIDVDQRPGNFPPYPYPARPTGYRIPPDNPFVGIDQYNGRPLDPAKVRTEFYAIGLRNPWRFTIDFQTGWLYCADVGQDSYEEIDIITKGGNYGWPYREGRHLARETVKAPPDLNLIEPITEHLHGNGTNQGSAVIGGVVYRGRKIPQLNGCYVYGDNVSGHIWSLRYDGHAATVPERLTSREGISAFAADPASGEVLVLSVSDGTIARLAYTAEPVGPPLPPTLADTGAFTDLRSLTTAPNMIAYNVNVPFWSDNARKSRWFQLGANGEPIGFFPKTNWAFPAGAVWVKHFDLDLTNSLPHAARRIETRFLVKTATGVYGVTYRWSDSHTNATLVPENGLDETLFIDDGGIRRVQQWHYPARVECISCHTKTAGYILGFNTAQLNLNRDCGGGRVENQLAEFGRRGFITPAPDNPSSLPALAPAGDTRASLEWRVRSFLAANCAQCHQPGGFGLGKWDARWWTPSDSAGLIDGPLENNFGDPANRVLARESLEHSILLRRISLRAPRQMPPYSTLITDPEAIALISAWITNGLPKGAISPQP